MAEKRSVMSMMEYSGDFGGTGGECHWEFARRDFSSSESLSDNGVRWVSMSEGEGSRVKSNMPELRS